MKRIFMALGLLAVITGFCIFSVVRVHRICDDTKAVLRQAETCCVNGDFKGVEGTVYLAQAIWKKHEGFLGMALRHTETDDISVMFSTLLEAASQRDSEEFMLRNRELLALINGLSHMEIPFHYNVL